MGFKAQQLNYDPKYKAQIILKYSKLFIQFRGLLLDAPFSPK